MNKLYFLLFVLCFCGGVNAQIINIPDGNFKAKLLAANSINGIASVQTPIYDSLNNSWSVSSYDKIDVNNDGEIQLTEAQSIKWLSISSSSIADLIGLEAFTSLQWLKCSDNKLTSLDVSTLISLQYLNCSFNQLQNLNLLGSTSLKDISCDNNLLTSLNVSNLTNLLYLNCGKNKLSNLNFSGLSKMEDLSCSDNLLTSLDVSFFLNLKTLFCDYNKISNLELSHNLNLVQVHCSDNLLRDLQFNNHPYLADIVCVNNQLSSFVLSNSPNLEILEIGNNNLKELDLSHTFNRLNFVECSNNELQVLILKNGVYDSGYIWFGGNPDLRYICADESEFDNLNAKVNEYGYIGCHVNSYCTFRPGGPFYTVSGVNRFDSDLNGCNSQDGLISKVKYKIIKGASEGYFVSNATGNYTIDLQAGTYTVIPEIENPELFAIQPVELKFSFNQNSTPFTQDFCITPNGRHTDVEVSVIPVEVARPGFDAKYKVVYKNKGNQVENGSLSLNFDDSKMDFVSTSTVSIQSAGALTWNYTNLTPFETRTIDVVFNINSPMESPAVNGGDILNYTASISTTNTDEQPSDNTFALNQTVVNSFDPNDITCLEGAKVSTAKVGDYVHYMIRFENTGSANAVNIVVKDVVDTTKFDVNSLVAQKGSHDYYTRINGDKVEFIFENINLPFDDATNDGYVFFKIKTKSNLVAGDSFSKNANIYFDYNFPITTNTAITTIAALAKQDFEFNSYFKLYPNPVANSLNLESKDTIEVGSIQIYNTLGQLVLVIPNAQNTKTIDVSTLTSGNYFIKVNSDKGTSNSKFIKQ